MICESGQGRSQSETKLIMLMCFDSIKARNTKHFGNTQFWGMAIYPNFTCGCRTSKYGGGLMYWVEVSIKGNERPATIPACFFEVCDVSVHVLKASQRMYLKL